MCETMLTFVQFTKFFLLSTQGLHWMVNVGRYQTVGESLQKNSQDTILTPSTSMSIVNVVVTNIEVKNEPQRSTNALSTSTINFY
jgi:hypothetical protein